MPIDNVTEGAPITTAWGNDVANTINGIETTVAGITPPPGVIVAYGGSIAPTGWLLCNGASVLRSTYAALFTAIGTAYGSVDGTHFTLPDLQQRFPLGKAASGTGTTLGSAGGNIDHTHTGAAHQHTGAAHTHTGPAHAHELPLTTGANARQHASSDFGTGSTVSATRIATTTADTSSFARALSENVSGGASGSTSPGNGGSTASTAGSTGNAPYQVVQYIIRT